MQMNQTISASKGRSLAQDAWARLLKNKLAIAGLFILVTMIFIALITPLIAPYTYEEQDLNLGASAPSYAHWLGTDVLGRDQLTRIMYGTRVSLSVGFIATGVALIIGVSWGAIAGFFGGRVDAVLMRMVDVLYALPFTIFIILLTVIFGSSLLLLFLAIGAVQWLTMARIVRGQVLMIKQQEFIEAAVTLGFSPWRILFKHLIPNVLGPVIVYVTLTIPEVILLESFLSFIGLGVQPPAASWGSLIAGGVDVMEQYYWLLFFPSLVLAITLFSLNFLGDGLRDALDPKSAKD